MAPKSIKKDEAIQGQSSTILSFSDPENPKILREGSIKKLSIEKTVDHFSNLF